MDRKQVKKAAAKTIKKVQATGADLEAKAMKEFEKIKKQMDSTVKKVESYVKKNPEKAAAIAAGVGMALGTVAGIIAGKTKKKK